MMIMVMIMMVIMTTFALNIDQDRIGNVDFHKVYFDLILVISCAKYFVHIFLLLRNLSPSHFPSFGFSATFFLVKLEKKL